MTASLADTYKAMAYNNAWSNHRLLKACLKLTQEEFVAERTSFFPSIFKTLNHTLIVDWFYVDAMEGGSLGPAAFADETPCATVSDVAREQKAVDARLLAICDDLTQDRLNENIHVHRGSRVQIERFDRLLAHVFTHQTHHRGQVHAMLSGTAQKPPQLDEFFSAGEAPLRAADFAELGWTAE